MLNWFMVNLSLILLINFMFIKKKYVDHLKFKLISIAAVKMYHNVLFLVSIAHSKLGHTAMCITPRAKM